MANELRANVLMACRTLLRPLVRLLIRSGVPWKDFADVSKLAFVDVAAHEFGLRGRPTNTVRVAILTGINRRDVARLREAAEAPIDGAPPALNAAQRILSGWFQDVDYLGSDGAPLAIGATGPAPSFEHLCARYGGNLTATALLKELRAAGNVDVDAAGQCRPTSRVYIPLKVDPAKTLRAGSVLADIGETVVHDLVCGPDELLRFERRAENPSIDPRHLPAFREFLAREGQAFLERVDDWLTCHETEGGGARSPVRLGVGVYHIQTDSIGAPARRGPRLPAGSPHPLEAASLPGLDAPQRALEHP